MSAPSRKSSLLVIFLTVFIDLLGFAMVLPLLPIYARQFHASPWMNGALMAVFSLMQLLSAPFWGRLSDRIGRRPVLMIGLSGSVVFYTLFGVATVMQSLLWLFVSRIGAGIAGATVPTAQAYIADRTTTGDRSKGMALIGMAFGLGFTFGPLLGFLAVPSGHGDPGPGPGYAAAALSAVALVLAYFKLPESLRRDGRPAARRIFDATALRRAIAMPSIGLLLAAIFVGVFALAAFETTLSLLIKGGERAASSPFHFSWGGVCLTFAYIGGVLALVQGGLVRRLAGRISERVFATGGAAAQVVGFALLILAISDASTAWLLTALAVVVSGYGMLSPSLNSLVSRRSDPKAQGAILGVAQSVNATARIFGSFVGIPLLAVRLTLPFYVAAALMASAVLLVVTAARRGRDYVAAS